MSNYKKKFDPQAHPPHRYGVLLINMGGPGSQEEIFDYLYRLFSDPFIIGLPGFMRHRLARFIAKGRKKKAAARYALIGGKSPLNEETNAQAKKLEEVLQLPVAFSMRYSEPFVQAAHKELEQKGVTRLIVLPLYPQYCRATTMSAMEDFLEHRGGDLPYRFIQQHYDSPSYIETLCQLLTDSLEQSKPGYKTSILFVAHSIPLKQVKAGDPYVEQVKATVNLTAQKSGLDYPFHLAFQSRIGPVKWQGPTLSEALHKLRKDNIEQLIVHPVSFVSENLETLYDLDIQFKEECLQAGIEHYIRVPAPGIHPLYINTLAYLVREEINNWEVRHAGT
jgi:ferrochelatase